MNEDKEKAPAASGPTFNADSGGGAITQGMEVDSSTNKQHNTQHGDGNTMSASQTNTIDQSQNHWEGVDEAVVSLPQADQDVVMPLVESLKPMAAFESFTDEAAESAFTQVLEELAPYEPLLGPIKAALQLTPIGAIGVPIAESLFQML